MDLIKEQMEIWEAETKEKIEPGKVRRDLLTILDDEIPTECESMVGSIEIINDDLETASKKIAELFNRSLDRTRGESLMFVTDTHPLIWYQNGKHSALSAKVLAAFQKE